MSKNTTDTNQASEEELTKIIDRVYLFGMNGGLGYEKFDNELSPNDAKAAIQAIIRTEKLELLDELDKSIPTAEQLTTKYGYHMPEKQYGYKLALHDIREVLTKLEAEL